MFSFGCNTNTTLNDIDENLLFSATERALALHVEGWVFESWQRYIYNQVPKVQSNARQLFHELTRSPCHRRYIRSTQNNPCCSMTMSIKNKTTIVLLVLLFYGYVLISKVIKSDDQLHANKQTFLVYVCYCIIPMHKNC